MPINFIFKFFEKKFKKDEKSIIRNNTMFRIEEEEEI